MLLIIRASYGKPPLHLRHFQSHPIHHMCIAYGAKCYKFHKSPKGGSIAARGVSEERLTKTEFRPLVADLKLISVNYESLLNPSVADDGIYWVVCWLIGDWWHSDQGYMKKSEVNGSVGGEPEDKKVLYSILIFQYQHSISIFQYQYFNITRFKTFSLDVP